MGRAAIVTWYSLLLITALKPRALACTKTCTKGMATQSSFLVQCGASSLFLFLGGCISLLLMGPEAGSRDHASTSCDQLLRASSLPPGMQSYMGSKLPYQFSVAIDNETTLHGCVADKVYIYGIVLGVYLNVYTLLTTFPLHCCKDNLHVDSL